MGSSWFNGRAQGSQHHRPRLSMRTLRRMLDATLVLTAFSLVVVMLGPPPAFDLLGLGQRFGWRLPGVSAPTAVATNALDDLPDTEIASALRALHVRDPTANQVGEYDRAFFGQRWADEDHNGCDTRNDVLARDLSRPQFVEETNNCVVAAGTLAEPYTGAIVQFRRGEGTSDLVQIDHVVALADSWRSGAWAWDDATRQRFANDPANLLAVDGEANQEKGSSTADEWMPESEDFHCEYATIQVSVKTAWNLSVTPAEQEALARALATCSTS